MDKQTIAFILLIIITLINPNLIYNLNKWSIGQIIILIVIIYFSCHNVVLGLLTIFLYFSVLDKYRYVIEGMSNEGMSNEGIPSEQKITTDNTIGEINLQEANNYKKDEKDEKDEKNKKDENKKDENKKDKIVISTSNINSNGIDIQDIRDSIAAKDSNSFPLSKSMFKSGDDVEPFNIR